MCFYFFFLIPKLKKKSVPDVQIVKLMRIVTWPVFNKTKHLQNYYTPLVTF